MLSEFGDPVTLARARKDQGQKTDCSEFKDSISRRRGPYVLYTSIAYSNM